MDITQLTGFIGDSTSFQIPLTWAGTAFAPGETWALIFTAKHRASDADDAAVFQKASNAGITLSGASTAVIATVPSDTATLQSCTLHCDIQAQHLTTGEVRTVGYARLALSRDITRETTVSLPIYTTEEYVARGETGETGPAGETGETGPAGPAPSGTGFVKVLDGVLENPSATISASEISDPENLVTNARVNTAISADPSKARSAMLAAPLTVPGPYADYWTAAAGFVKEGSIYHDAAITLHVRKLPEIASATTYFSANSIIDTDTKNRINRFLTYLSDNSLTPDDAIFFRGYQQPSATSPKSLAGVTLTTAGTPTKTVRGLSLNGTTQHILMSGITSLGDMTLVMDVEGDDSGNANYASMYSVNGATGLYNGGGHAGELLTGAEKPMVIYTRNGVPQAGTTSAMSDNGDNFEIGAFLGDPQVVAISANAAGTTYQMGVNGSWLVTDSTGNYGGSSLTRLVIGARNTSDANTFAQRYKMTVGAALLYRSVLTAPQLVIVNKAMHMLETRDVCFCVAGDSNSSKRADSARTSENWPGQLIQGNSARKSKIRLMNYAKSGQHAAYSSSVYTERVQPYRPNELPYLRGYYAQMFGTNDIAYASTTAAQIYADRKAGMTLARADGFIGIHLTVIRAISKGAFAAFTAPQETKREDLNNLVASGYSAGDCDYFVDLRTVNQLEDAVPAFFYDGFHLNGEGYKLIAEEVAATVPMPETGLPRCTVKPIISGGMSLLSVTNGTWENAESYTYQWYVVPLGTSDVISSVLGTSATFNASGYSGQRVFCRVTATNANGSQSRSSNLTATL